MLMRLGIISCLCVAGIILALGVGGCAARDSANPFVSPIPPQPLP